MKMDIDFVIMFTIWPGIVIVVLVLVNSYVWSGEDNCWEEIIIWLCVICTGEPKLFNSGL